MMILEALAGQFVQRFQHEKRSRVCLWFDEKHEFLRLLPAFREFLAATSDPPFQLLEYDSETFHGQVWIKHQVWKNLLSPASDTSLENRFVIYLPLSEERLEKPDSHGSHHLELLLEYKVTGLIWRISGKRPTLFSFLKQSGVSLPDNPSDQRKLWEGGSDSLLAKYVKKFIDRPKDFWETLLTPELAQSRLVGDIDQTILDIAVTPEETWAELQERGLEKEFVNAVRERYGFEFPVSNPERWIEELVTILALTETFLGYGEASDFPFLGRLPAIALRDHHAQLLRRWLRDAESRPAWDHWVSEVESKLNLSDWAAKKDGLSFAFPHLVRDRWNQTFQIFQETASKLSEVLGFFEKYSSLIRREGEFARASHLPIGSWELMDSLGQFLAMAEQAVARIPSEDAIAGIVGLYLELAPVIDRQHLNIRHQALEKELPAIAEVADRAYARYTNLLNQKFFELYISQPEVDLPGIPAVGQRAEKAIWKAKGKRAVIIIDSLRYDCAHEIKRILSGLEVKIEPVRAAIPPVTSLGMTALMPLSGTKLSFECQGNSLQPKVNGKDMSQRQNRIEYLASSGADCRDIDDLEALSTAPKGLGELVVVFGHEAIDGLGHENASTLILHINLEIERIGRLVRKLHRWGYPTVHILTDHGFILVDDEQLPPEIKCDKAWTLVLKERFALVPASADLPIKSIPFAWDESIRVAVPPGMAFFKNEKSFSHGGITLQELIIPHLVSRMHAAKPKAFGVEVVLPTFTLMQSMVKVTLRAVPPQAAAPHQMPCFTDQGRTLRLNVVRTEGERQPSSILADGKPKIVKLDLGENKEVKASLFFQSALSFKAGEFLDLDIRDADTDEQFPPGGIKLTVGRNI